MMKLCKLIVTQIQQDFISAVETLDSGGLQAKKPIEAPQTQSSCHTVTRNLSQGGFRAVAV